MYRLLFHIQPIFVLLEFLAASAPTAAFGDSQCSAVDSALCHKPESLAETSLLQVSVGVQNKAHSQSHSAVLGRSLPSLQVDLDEPPEERWNHVMDYYCKLGIAQAGIDYFLSLEDAHFSNSTQKLWTDAITAVMSDESKREAKGMAARCRRYGATVTAEEIMHFNFLYEMNWPGFCSGVLAAMPDGTVIHGRNMDYPLQVPWRNKTIGFAELSTEVTFVRGGQPLFVSVQWPFHMGIHTAMRFDGWTYETNSRRELPPGDTDFAGASLIAIQKGGKNVGLLAREIMEQVPDFEDAVQAMWSVSRAAPAYAIMSGPKPYQGAVVAADTLGRHLPDSAPIERLSPQKTSWHLVQTNDDLTKRPNDVRRPTEQARLAAAKQSQVSPSWMFGQMLAPPLFNEGTVFTWVACVGTRYNELRIRPGSIDLAKLE